MPGNGYAIVAWYTGGNGRNQSNCHRAAFLSTNLRYDYR